MGREKIKDLDELVNILEKERASGKKVVHCHGCFDCLHFGHIKHFEAAKKQGDVLVVTVTPDQYIEKGPGSPFYNQDLRLEFLSSIEFVDFVALNKWPTAVETILRLKPNFYVKGKEVLGNKNVDEIIRGSEKISNLDYEIEALKKIGGVIYLTDEMTFSSSRIINQITSAIPDESKEYLEKFRKKHSSNEIEEKLHSLKDIKILAIGDAVLDEYVYCKDMERSGKESLISYKFLESTTHLGGVFAVANHLAGFSDNVSLITCIGNNTYEFVESSLNNRIGRNIFVQKDSETIIKKRYIDKYRLHKVFQVYNKDELIINKDSEEKILRFLEQNSPRFDMILVSDLGHGMISPRILDYISSTNKFLAVNCQLNAGNLGYNFITKYKRANFVTINEKELRLPFQEKTSNIEIPIKKLSEYLKIDRINITVGKAGSIYYHNQDFYSSPSFTKEPLDTMGAGDAVFSLTSLLAYKDSEPEILSFLGNCIGGLATRIIGNERAVNPGELKRFVSYIMR